MTQSLPSEFSNLEPFCEKWLHPSEARRNEVRISSSMEEIREFYDAVLPQFEQVIQFLNQKPLTELDDKEENLLNLSFSFVEASTPIERFNSPVVTELFPPERFKIYADSVATGV